MALCAADTLTAGCLLVNREQYVVVTGGIMSGLGKGITASSIAVLLQGCGWKVSMIKIDPYLNVDAGTMSPFEHGETFVLDDGGETDLDLGNYERFLDISLGADNNITTGKVYKAVIEASARASTWVRQFRWCRTLRMPLATGLSASPPRPSSLEPTQRMRATRLTSASLSSVALLVTSKVCLSSRSLLLLSLSLRAHPPFLGIAALACEG
jgi:hypothetical protein